MPTNVTPARGSELDPFPKEWVDIMDPHAHQATLREVYEHVKDYLDHNRESPFDDSPIETPTSEDWECMATAQIPTAFLSFLTSTQTTGLSFTITGVFLLLVHMNATTFEELVASMLTTMRRDQQGIYSADESKIVSQFGVQATKAHSRELARLCTFYQCIQEH